MKRLLAAFISALMVFSVLSVCVSGSYIYDDTYSLGDINGDGTANAKDLHSLRAYTAEYEPEGKFITDAADINADGKANARDALYFKAVFSGAASFSDYEKSSPVYSASIGGAALENFCVTVPDGMEPEGKEYAVQNAAMIFQRGVFNATGVWLEICNESSADKENLVAFHVAEPDETVDGHTFGVEDYYYKVTDGRLDVYGSKYRGNIYASYEILEEYFGLYWFSCEETLIYKRRCVEMETGTVVYHQPVFSYRFAVENFYDPGSRIGALGYYFPRRLNGTQIGAYTGDYYGSLTGPHAYNAHSFQEYYRMYHGVIPDDPTLDRAAQLRAKYESCPDPNANNDWQPCASDNEVYAELFEGLLLTMEMIVIPPRNNNVFRHEDGLSAMSFSICDNAEFCKCRICSRKVNGTRIKLNSSNISVLDSYSGEYTLDDNGYVTFKKESYSGLYLDMGNRAARDIQEMYPGMKIYMIIYDHTIPESIRPDENLILMYCGNGCNNHYINSGECGDNQTYLKTSNTETVKTLVEWTKMCHDAGALIWFWYYPITNGYYLNGCPNILNIYYDFTYLASIGIDGIYYEGGDKEYNFETLKAYLATKVMWDPQMTYEEYTDIMKEYLRVYYGDGYEYIYQYILLDDEAGNACGCFINNHDRPFDMHSKQYLGEHYEQMHDLLATALTLCKTDKQRERLTLLYYCAEFMGLSGAYDRLYTEGNAESRALYEERYTEMYNYMYERDLQIFHTPDIYSVPDELDFSKSPMTQFYVLGSWNGWDK
ncbi:MAG: DUF4838 domain-containing protein [Clostridia bacterium]|nr:DUF4838 domain-containing protein [Clostridia bacterium]